MLTGDTTGPALAVADSIGLPRDDVYAALMPEDKLAFVSSLILHLPKSASTVLTGLSMQIKDSKRCI